MAKKTTGLVGFKQSNKPPLGTYQVHFVRMVQKLGRKAYGAEIERQLTGQGVDTDRGQVYQTGSRLEGRGFLSSSDMPDPNRPTYTVTCYAVTKAGEDALAASIAVYDGHRLFEAARKVDRKKGR